MSSIAAVILAHDDPAKVRRLISSLEGADVFLHCDRGTPNSVMRAMLPTGVGVGLIPRRGTTLASWSLVEAELSGLRLALDRTAAEHIAVLSGSCYPLLPITKLEDELSAWRGLSRIQLSPLPYAPWNTPRNRDGGYWRFRRRFVSFHGQVVSIRHVPLRTFRQRVPQCLRLHASSQWKVYARRHAAELLRVLTERPEQLRFWRRTLVPEESCAASILSTPDLVGAVTEELRDDSAWYVKWRENHTGHPEWLTDADYPALLAARTAPHRNPADAIPQSARGTFSKWFARKFSSRDHSLLDRVDLELRV